MKYHSPALITGASGFVGGHLAETLAAKRVRVKLLVRRTSRLPFKPGPLMEPCYGDVTDPESLKKAVKGTRIVYHLAGILRGSDRNQLENVNAQGTENVCRAMAGERGPKRLVCVSSLSAAGPSRPGKPITEADPCRPVSLYGETKLKGEQIALSYQKKFPVTVVRPAAVYGPRETDIFAYFKMVRQGLVLIPGDGRQEVSFVHVADVVDSLLLAGTSPKAVGETYFVSDGKSYRWDEFAGFVGKALKRSFITIRIPMGIVRIVAEFGELGAKITGKPTMVNRDKIKEGAAPAWVCSDAKISKQLGFRPKFNLAKGVEDTVKFYLSAGWLKP
jgi:dihydroflavonol-4-reductase